MVSSDPPQQQPEQGPAWRPCVDEDPYFKAHSVQVRRSGARRTARTARHYRRRSRCTSSHRDNELICSSLLFLDLDLHLLLLRVDKVDAFYDILEHSLSVDPNVALVRFDKHLTEVAEVSLRGSLYEVLAGKLVLRESDASRHVKVKFGKDLIAVGLALVIAADFS